MKRVILLSLFGVVIVGSGLMAFRNSGRYGTPAPDDRRVHRERDASGQITKLIYDVNGNFKPDTTSYVANGVVVRTEVDRDEDGRIDTWYLYGPDGKLTRTGSSSKNDGVADTWVDEPPAAPQQSVRKN